MRNDNLETPLPLNKKNSWSWSLKIRGAGAWTLGWVASYHTLLLYLSHLLFKSLFFVESALTMDAGSSAVSAAMRRDRKLEAARVAALRSSRGIPSSFKKPVREQQSPPPPPQQSRKAAVKEARTERLDCRLSWLCENKKWDKVLSYLRVHPEEASLEDVNGDFCLSYLADLKAPLEVVDAMIKANPYAAIKKDSYGHTPLMWATKRAHAWKVIEILLTSWPEDVDRKLLACEKYDGGQLLLHVACAKCAPIEIISALLDIYPDAAKQKDDEGMIPLQLSMNHPKTDTETMDMLFVSNPVSEFADDGIVNRNCLKIMQDLRDYPPTLKEDSVSWTREIPTGIRLAWSYFVSCPDPEDKFLPQVSAILNGRTAIEAQYLSEALSRDGVKTCYEVATPAIKAAIKQRLPFMKRYILSSGPPIHSTKTTLIRRAKDLGANIDYRGAFCRYCTAPSSGLSNNNRGATTPPPSNGAYGGSSAERRLPLYNPRNPAICPFQDAMSFLGMKESEFKKLTEKPEELREKYEIDLKAGPNEGQFIKFCEGVFDGGSSRDVVIKVSAC